MLNDAVKLRTNADVEVANFLSGGLDSTSIISVQKQNNIITNSFSVGYNDSKYDESEWFNEVAKKYNTNQYEGSLINDLTFNSNKNISNNGFVNSYKMLLRNVNTDLENSTESENAINHQLLSTMLFQSKYPLQRSEQNNKSSI